MSIVVSVAVRFLEGIFMVGAAGCVVVLLLTAVEDFETLLGRDRDSVQPASGD